MIPGSLQPLFNHLWQSTLFAACAALLTLVLRKNRAHTRYGLWLVASAKFLVPFSFLVGAASRFGRHPAAAIMPPALPPMIQRASQPFALPASMVATPAVHPAVPSVMPVILGAVWAIGFAILIFSWWRRWRNLSASVRTATPLDLPIGVKVMSSPAFPEPGVFGILHPVLLLPKGIMGQLTAPQLESVVAHELCHIRRRDNLATAMHMVVEAVFWFHPLVWWLGARLIGERERACDEEVLRLGNEPAAYAEGILRVCELYLETPLPCVAGVTGANLRRRIEEIMTRRIAMNLDSRRKLLLALAGVCVVAGPLLVGLSADSSGPKFEVASVRLCEDFGRGRADTKMGPAGGSPTFSPGRLNTGCALLAANYPMSGLIQRVYGRLKLGGPPPLGAALPVSGGPAWIYSDYYVINAQTAEKASTEAMKGPMLQALLEDRFKLKVHRETRQVPVYLLTLAKGGPKLQQVPQGSCVPPDYSTWPMPALPPGKSYCVSRGAGGRKGPNTTIHEDEATVDYVCKLLQLVMDRPVVDRTGLTGQYKFDLEFAIDQSTPGVVGPEYAQPSDDPPAPSIFTVMQRLGLKMEATKGPRDFLVIDHVERPTPN
jgi:bla regulator protein blaR1